MDYIVAHHSNGNFKWIVVTDFLQRPYDKVKNLGRSLFARYRKNENFGEPYQDVYQKGRTADAAQAYAVMESLKQREKNVKKDTTSLKAVARMEGSNAVTKSESNSESSVTRPQGFPDTDKRDISRPTEMEGHSRFSGSQYFDQLV